MNPSSELKISILGATIFIVCLLSVFGSFAQAPEVKPEATPAVEAPKSVIKAFPPGLGASYNLKLTEVAALQAQLRAAQSESQVILYQVAYEIGLTKAETDTCHTQKNQNGAWVFECPPPEPPKKAAKK